MHTHILSLSLSLSLTGVDVARHKLEQLVDENDRDGQQNHSLPLVAIQRLQLEQILQKAVHMYV